MLNRRILFIDDDPDLRQSYEDIFAFLPEKLGIYTTQLRQLFPGRHPKQITDTVHFETSLAAQGEEGFELVKARLAKDLPFAVAFIDVRMPPGWDGIETATRIRRIDPDIEIVMVTAYADRSLEEFIQAIGAPDKLLLLRKPFDPEEIIQMALSLTEKWNMARQEEQLRNELQNILMTTPAAIFTIDRNRCITSWNAGAEAITGYTTEEVLGRHCIYNRLTEHRAYHCCAIDFNTPDKTIQNQEITIIDKSGRRRAVSKSVSFTRDHSGRVVGAVESFWDVTKQKEALEQLAREVEERERLANINAVMEERGRLARELHDSVTQTLYSIFLFAETAKHMAAEGALDKLDLCLDELKFAANSSLKEMRLLIYNLRPSILQEEGLAEAIQQRLDSVENRSGIKGSLVIDGNGVISEREEETIYRIIQEALNNTLKHSSARKVHVHLAIKQDSVELEVADDGIGIIPENKTDKGGLGLTSIRERLEKLGGTMSIHSNSDGTVIRGNFPRKKPAAPTPVSTIPQV